MIFDSDLSGKLLIQNWFCLYFPQKILLRVARYALWVQVTGCKIQDARRKLQVIQSRLAQRTQPFQLNLEALNPVVQL